MKKAKKHSNVSFSQRLLELISEPVFIKLNHILSEPNFFKIVGRTHYERWHSNFWGWLLDPNGSHLLHDYVLKRFLLLLFDPRCLKSVDHSKISLDKILPTAEFKNVEVAPNEFLSTETNVKGVGRFDIFLTANYENASQKLEGDRLNIIFELKIDSKINSEQSKKYGDWLINNYPKDTNVLIYILPQLQSGSKATVGDERWYCIDYQLINDKMLIPVLDHPHLNPKIQPFIIQYIKNLKIRYKGIKMAITNEEKKIAIDLYEKYSDVFDAIFDALQEAEIVAFSTTDINIRGRKSGKIAVNLNGKIFEGDDVRKLFKKILIYLVDSGLFNKIPMPWGKGNIRYIVSNEQAPTHPNGRPFFGPESYKGYTIETHYSRERALSVLSTLCDKLEINYEPINV